MTGIWRTHQPAVVAVVVVVVIIVVVVICGDGSRWRRSRGGSTVVMTAAGRWLGVHSYPYP